jgi:hypothetical protein
MNILFLLCFFFFNLVYFENINIYKFIICFKIYMYIYVNKKKKIKNINILFNNSFYLKNI